MTHSQWEDQEDRGDSQELSLNEVELEFHELLWGNSRQAKQEGQELHAGKVSDIKGIDYEGSGVRDIPQESVR